MSVRGLARELASAFGAPFTDPAETDLPGPDLLGGRVTMMFSTIVGALPLVREEKLRALAVTSLRRSSAVLEVPTIAESGYPGFEVTGWSGWLGGPVGHAESGRTAAFYPYSTIRASRTDPIPRRNVRTRERNIVSRQTSVGKPPVPVPSSGNAMLCTLSESAW